VSLAVVVEGDTDLPVVRHPALQPCRFACAALLLAVLAGAAPAQDGAVRERWARTDAAACAEGSGIASLDIVTCTRAIRLGGHSPATLATLHAVRGRAYRLTGRLEAALRDQDAALEANPLSAQALRDRALVQLDLGNRGAAIADLDRAVTLNPFFAEAWRDRGWARFLAGDDEGAERDLARTDALDPSDAATHAFRGFVAYRQRRFDAAARHFRRAEERHFGYPYAPVWEFLAVERAGGDGEPVLRTAIERLPASEWPRPLLRALLGEVGEDSIARALDGVGERLRAEREAQVAFYLAQAERLAGREQAAARRLAQARASLARDAVERAMLPRSR